MLYTFKRERDFGADLDGGALRGSSLDKAFRGAMRGETTLSDFEAYAPSGGKPAAFLAAPLRSGARTIGVVVLQVDLTALNAMMVVRKGLGRSGETYLVGSDRLMRTDSRFAETSTVLKKRVDTAGVRAALAGKPGCKLIKDYRDIPVYSCYSRFDAGGLDWVMLAELDESEAMEPAADLRDSALVAFFSLALVVILASLGLTRNITRPITGAVARLRRP